MQGKRELLHAINIFLDDVSMGTYQQRKHFYNNIFSRKLKLKIENLIVLLLAIQFECVEYQATIALQVKINL
jgi:hypothetical protein